MESNSILETVEPAPTDQEEKQGNASVGQHRESAPSKVGSSSISQVYKAFLQKNADAVATFESTVRSATYLLPGRFEGAEIASEGVFTALTLLGHLNTSILSPISYKSSPTTLQQSLVEKLTPHDRYTQAWSIHSKVYKRVSRSLVLIGYIELLIEMLGRRRWNKIGWKGGKEGGGRVLIGIESVKTLLRFILLLITRRPLITPPTPSHEPSPSTSQPPAPSNQSRTDPINTILLPSTLYSHSITPPKELIGPLNGPSEWTSELIDISRGLVYVSLLHALTQREKRYSTTIPLAVSISLTLLSHKYLSKKPVTVLEREEASIRKKRMGMWAFRGVVWDSLTKPVLESFISKTENIPIVNLVTNLASDYIPLVDDYYYYTAD